MKQSTLLYVISASVIIYGASIPSANASTWVPVSLIGQDTTWLNEGGTFTDNLIDFDPPVLFTDTREPPSGTNFKIEISFLPWNTSPPEVDVHMKTIDLSSLSATVLQGEVCEAHGACAPGVSPGTLVWTPAIGWTFAPLEPVPYIANHDGTLTATWLTSSSRTGFEGFQIGSPMAFTFASAPVPEPHTCVMLLAGLGLISWRACWGRNSLQLATRIGT